MSALDNYCLQGLSATDLPAITCVHEASFPNSALTQLGSRCIHKYYQWQFDGPHDLFTVGAFDDTVLTAYCFSGTFYHALEGFLANNRWLLVRSVATRPALVFNPLIRARVRLAIRLLHRTRVTQCDEGRKPERNFGVLSIAVHPAHRRRGLGSRMMAACEQAAVDRGRRRIFLTVQPDNVGAITFYRSQGWKNWTESGDWQGTMCKPITDTS